MFDAITATVQQADVNANGFEQPFRQLVSAVVQRASVQRHVPFERVRPQTVNLQNIVDVAVWPGHAFVKLPQRPGRLFPADDVDPTHASQVQFNESSHHALTLNVSLGYDQMIDTEPPWTREKNPEKNYQIEDFRKIQKFGEPAERGRRLDTFGRGGGDRDNH